MSNLGKTGREWKVYYNTGTHATPTWTQIAERADISISLSKDELEVLRDGAEFREYLKGYKDLTIEMGFTYENANTNFVYLKDDFFADDDDYIDLLILDGPQGTSGSQGIRGILALTGMPIEAPLGDATSCTMTFRPTPAEESGSFVETDWFTVS